MNALHGRAQPIDMPELPQQYKNGRPVNKRGLLYTFISKIN
ncbi:hypothetical protein [Xenorhabdus kozodoii]|nr:hypothetical protein [Xenorhabdus kozodoii]